LIHVATNDKVVSDDEASLSLVAKLKQLQETKKVLNKARDKKNDQTLHPADIERGFQLIDEVDGIQQKKALLQQQLQVATKERDAIAPWGDFDPQILKKYQIAAIRFIFLLFRVLNKPEWESKFDAIVIKQEASKTYFITVTKSDVPIDELNIEEVKIPEVSLSKLNGLTDSLKDEMATARLQMTQLSADIPSLDVAIKQVESEITFARVKSSGNKLADDK
jgi:V/A-type H+-transporting ATPase subunit I